MSGTRAWLSAAAIAAGVHGAVAGAGILLGLEGSSEWYDQANYHLPVIERFAAELPAPTLSDYNSATTPGYHLLMASLRALGAPVGALHALTLAIGMGLVALVAAAVARRAGFAAGAAAGAMLGCSPYVLSGSIWLNTDNLGLALVVLALLAALPLATESRGEGSVAGRRAVALAAAASAAAVLVRQVLLFAAAIPAAAFVARAVSERRMPTARECAVGIAALVPAMLVVAAFVLAWGGLVPPTFRQYHGSGANPVTPVYALALVGCWGTIAFACVPGFLRELRSRRMLLVAALAGLACLAVRSDFVQHVRWGGVLWSVAKELPAPAGRSVVLVPLAALGAAALGAFLRISLDSVRTSRDGAPIVPLLVLVGVIAAQTANQQCFERYLQPSVVVLCLLAAAIHARGSMRAAPLVAGAALALAASAVNLLRGA